MNASFKKATLFFIIAVPAAFLIFFASCNKDAGAGSTRYKCVSCGSSGVCQNDTCNCYTGFEGLTCQTEIREKFCGAWNVTEQSGGDTASYPININADSRNITYVVIQYLFREKDTLTVSAYAAGDSLIIPMQYTNGLMVIGAGYISGNQAAAFEQPGTITMRYAVKDTTTGAVTDFGYYSATGSPSVWTAPALL